MQADSGDAQSSIYDAVLRLLLNIIRVDRRQDFFYRGPYLSRQASTLYSRCLLKQHSLLIQRIDKPV